MSDQTPATQVIPALPADAAAPASETPPPGAPTTPVTPPPQLPRKIIRSTAAAFAGLGIAAAVAFTWILAAHDGDLTAAETISIFLMGPGLVLLGFGVGVHVLETFVATEDSTGGFDSDVTDPTGIGEVIVAAFKDMSGGKLFMATGLLLMLVNAYVAKA